MNQARMHTWKLLQLDKDVTQKQMLKQTCLNIMNTENQHD